MFKVMLKMPNSERGAIMHVRGLGELKNGELMEFGDEVDATFKHMNSTVVNGKLVPGPGLVQAFKKSKNITVTNTKDPVESTEGGES